MRTLVLVGLLAALGSSSLSAQSFLTPPPEPSGNPTTPEKAALGQALFWDEQLSSSQTVSCGTCHQPAAGGSDARVLLRPAESLHPGFDGVLGTADDVRGSLGLVRRLANGDYSPSPLFGLDPQVTPRRTTPTVNALLNTVLFWDGRAAFTYRNPNTGAVVLPAWAALESQAVLPFVGELEMAHVGRRWPALEAEVGALKPLQLSPSIPGPLAAWINGRDYDALFAEAFGSPGVDIDRIAMALAAYQRTLFSDQTRFDAFMNGDTQALTAQEQRGLALFQGKGRCIDCHSFPQTGRQQFQYTGVRPVSEDLGRGAITGLASDDGKMLTPGLRNVSLRAPYFSDGSAADLQAVIDFYDRGGDFDHPNKSASVAPIGFSQQEKDDLIAFLRDAMLDARVAQETGPFARPLLRSEVPSQRVELGFGTPGTGGVIPQLVFDDPIRIGGRLRIGVADAPQGATAFLAVDRVANVTGAPYQGVTVFLAGSAALRQAQPRPINAEGVATFRDPVPNQSSLVGVKLTIQGLVADPGGPQGLSATPAVQTEILL